MTNLVPAGETLLSVSLPENVNGSRVLLLLLGSDRRAGRNVGQFGLRVVLDGVLGLKTSLGHDVGVGDLHKKVQVSARSRGGGESNARRWPSSCSKRQSRTPFQVSSSLPPSKAQS